MLCRKFYCNLNCYSVLINSSKLKRVDYFGSKVGSRLFMKNIICLQNNTTFSLMSTKTIKNLAKPLNSCHFKPYGTNSEKPITTKQKLNNAVKDYGVTVIVFHISISLLSLGFFYLAVYSGLDIPGIINACGLPMSEKLISVTNGASTFVVAYAIHKVFAPVRISVTLGTIPFVVRYLRKIGVLKKRNG